MNIPRLGTVHSHPPIFIFPVSSRRRRRNEIPNSSPQQIFPSALVPKQSSGRDTTRLVEDRAHDLRVREELPRRLAVRTGGGGGVGVEGVPAALRAEEHVSSVVEDEVDVEEEDGNEAREG
jgi:hypothetical protein